MWKICSLLRHSKEIGRISTKHFTTCTASLNSRFHQPRNRSGTTTQQDEDDNFGSLAEKHGQVFRKPSFVDVAELLTKNGSDDDVLNHLNEGDTNIRHDPYWYMLECKKLGQRGKIDECEQMLVHKMLKVDRVRPKNYNFAVVIGVLGRAGRAEKAFQLYYKILDYNLKPDLAVYTSLFNSVANSPNREHIKYAKSLYGKLSPNKNLLNSTVYNSILKAYARQCSSHVECFVIFQDMLRAGKVPDHITFIALMDACGKDRTSGFLHALQVWRQMTTLGIQPTVESLTVFLRICCKCGIGDADVATRTLLSEESLEKLKPSANFLESTFRNVYWQKGQQSFPQQQQQPTDNQQQQLDGVGDSQVLLLDALQVVDVDEISKTTEETEAVDDPEAAVAVDDPEAATVVAVDDPEAATVVGLMRQPISGMVEKIGECRSKWDRLQLVGGQRAVLDMIIDQQMQPRTQTFLWLAKCCQPDFDSEIELLKFYCRKDHRKSIDVRFFNIMMKRRAERRDYEGAEQIFRYLKRYKLKPDHFTFKVKAMLVDDESQMVQFLDRYCQVDIDVELGLRADVHVYNQLYARIFSMEKRSVAGYQDTYAINYDLLKRVMVQMKANKVDVNKWTLTMLERARNFPPKYDRWARQENQIERDVKDYRIFYNEWLKKQKMTHEG